MKNALFNRTLLKKKPRCNYIYYKKNYVILYNLIINML